MAIEAGRPTPNDTMHTKVVNGMTAAGFAANAADTTGIDATAAGTSTVGTWRITLEYKHWNMKPRIHDSEYQVRNRQPEIETMVYKT